VKPQNVLLNGDGRAKVTDFGIARSIEVEGMTRAGTVLGTSDYIAPEQASGQPVDTQTDVYSLGIVLYELLAGEVPFAGDNFVAVAMKHVNELPPNLLEVRGDVPVRVANAIDRALEKDPDRRFPSMDAFAAELDACLAEIEHGSADDTQEQIAPARARAAVRRPKPVSPWAIAIALVGLVAIAAVVIGFFALHGHGTKGGVPAAVHIRLHGLRGYDPYGDNHAEHDSMAGLATDGQRGTAWTTEHYDGANLGKPGVGLLLDAERPVSPRGITIDTSTPGFTAGLLAGDNAGGSDFRQVARPQTINGEITIPLDLHAPRRYFVIWITHLPPGIDQAQINEVRAG
jgi:hypothetical protein